MKFVCPIFLFFFNIGLVTAQENYPKPIKQKHYYFTYNIVIITTHIYMI